MQYVFLTNGHRISFDSIRKAAQYFKVSSQTVEKALYRHSVSGFHPEIFTSNLGDVITANTRLIGNYKQKSYIKNDHFEEFKDTITYFDVDKNLSKGNSKFVYIAKSKDITLMEAGLPNLFRQIFIHDHLKDMSENYYNKRFHQLIDLTRWYLKHKKVAEYSSFTITKIT